VFHEFDSDSAAMIVLEGDQPLGADAHHYYDGLIQKFSEDTKHVEHIQNFWGDPLTAAGSQSSDGKAALVQLYLAGNQGESLANESVDSVRNIVDHTPPPPGIKAYVTGAAPLVTDQFKVGRHGTLKTTLITIGVIGQAYDASKTDDSFYLPPEAFTNPEFQRGLKLFLSPDGKAARMIITHDGDPATPEGISHIDAIRHAAQEAVKGTPLAGSKIYIAGTAATYKDIQDGAKYDLMIAGIAALSLILLVMMFITLSIVAALVIVGTVALSLGASFGLSVLIWQDLLGIQLYWIVLALAVILLLAVGSDYNLLLISRFKEEIGAGLNTGIIRAMAGSGAVVTAAGLVFAATMASFVFADLRILGQIGTTIALGLLFDTLIVRSFMTPSIAALLGRWFWWPLKVRPRPASRMVQPYGSRHAVRQLLLWEDGDPAVSEAPPRP
jgi:putative drug exporter of the RND superfamily